MSETLWIRVLLFREGEQWIAQGLDLDLVAHGSTEEQSKRAFERIVTARLNFNRDRGLAARAGIAQAPQEFWDAFNAITNNQTLMERPEPIAWSDEDSDDVVPPAFMIPAIQHDSHHRP